MLLKYCSIQPHLYSNVTVDFLKGPGATMGTARSEWATAYTALVCTLGNALRGAQDLSPGSLPGLDVCPGPG